MAAPKSKNHYKSYKRHKLKLNKIYIPTLVKKSKYLREIC